MKIILTQIAGIASEDRSRSLEITRFKGCFVLYLNKFNQQKRRSSTFDEVDVVMFSPDKRCVDVVWNTREAVPDAPWISRVQLVCRRPIAVPPVTITLNTFSLHIPS